MATSYNQRSHAVRSAQKLGSVFSATPRVSNDGFDSLSDTSSILSQDTTSSHRSFSTKLGRRKPAPTPILLPMDQDSNRRHSLPSPASSAHTSPSSAEFDHPPLTATRRRAAQLAKLSRHLGENIPPEVLFGLPPTKYTSSSPSTATIGKRMRGKSISGPAHVASSPSATVYARTPTRGHFSRPSQVSVVHRDPMPFSDVQWDGAESSDSGDESSDWPRRAGSRAGRAEGDWEGEWNRMSMGEVRNKLRELRA